MDTVEPHGASGQLASQQTMMSVECESGKTLQPLRMKAYVLLFVAIGFAVFIRIALFNLVETGGDARSNWIASHQLLFGQHGVLDLSYSRMGIQIPTAFVIALFGSHAFVYHLTPILMSLLSIVICFLLVHRFSGVGLALGATFAFTIFPPFYRNAVQLLPGIFSCTYLLLTLFALVWVLEDRGSNKKLLLLALAVFFGYLAKFTDLFVLPGVLLALYFGGVTKSRIFGFLCLLFLLYLCEHCYFAFHGWPLGRMEMLLADSSIESSPSRQALWEIRSFSEFFTKRYSPSVLGADWWMLYQFFVGSSVLLLIFGRKSLRLLLLVTWSHLLINTFAIQSTDPLMTVTRPIMRYNSLYAGAMIATVFLATGELVGWLRLKANTLPPSPRKWLPKLGGHLIPVAVSFVLLAHFGRVLPASLSNYYQRFQNGHHPLQLTFRYFEIISNAFEKNIPILTAPGTSKRLSIANSVFRARKKEDWRGAPKDHMRVITVGEKQFLIVSSFGAREVATQLTSMKPSEEIVWVSPKSEFELRILPLGQVLGE